MRKACKQALDAINMHTGNSPVILPALTFNMFSHYLTSRKRGTGAYMGKATYNGIRSSLCHMYRMSGQVMSDDMQRQMSVLMSGMKRVVASDRVARGESLDEGERPMAFAVYQKMCEILYYGEDHEYLFAHSYLTMEWNLMARSDNCVSMGISHIQWQVATPTLPKVQLHQVQKLLLLSLL